MNPLGRSSLSSPLQTMSLFEGKPLIHTDSFQMELNLSTLLSLPLLILTGLPSPPQPFTQAKHHRAIHSEKRISSLGDGSAKKEGKQKEGSVSVMEKEADHVRARTDEGKEQEAWSDTGGRHSAWKF